jgi:hypothetical protein
MPRQFAPISIKCLVSLGGTLRWFMLENGDFPTHFTPDPPMSGSEFRGGTPEAIG